MSLKRLTTFNETEMSMDYELKHGQVLVIAWPQGSGKTILARSIAEKQGTFVETDACTLQSSFRLGNLLAQSPDTIIVDGVSADTITAPETKQLVSSERLVMHRKMCEDEEVATPNFIFCTSDADPLPLATEDRRFLVVHLGATTVAPRLVSNKFVSENQDTIPCNTGPWTPSGKTLGKVNKKRKRNPERWR